MADENWRSFEQALHKSQEGSRDSTQPLWHNGAIGSTKLPLAALQRTGQTTLISFYSLSLFLLFLNKLLKEKDVNKPLRVAPF